MNRHALILLAGLLLSCEQNQGRPTVAPPEIDRYFPLKEFVAQQSEILDGAKVRKKASIREEKLVVEEVFNAEEWGYELSVFAQADINKVSMASSYDILEEKGATVYRLKPDEQSAIKEIKVTYENEQVNRVSFISYKENLFYTSGSTGELVLDPESGKLSSYYVGASQKAWFLPVNEMEIEGEILSP